jgi:hypothetical protein
MDFAFEAKISLDKILTVGICGVFTHLPDLQAFLLNP